METTLNLSTVWGIIQPRTYISSGGNSETINRIETLYFMNKYVNKSINYRSINYCLFSNIRQLAVLCRMHFVTREQILFM